MQLNWKSAPSVQRPQDQISSAVDRHVPAKLRPDLQDVCCTMLDAWQKSEVKGHTCTCIHHLQEFPSHTCTCIHHLQEFPSNTRVPELWPYSSCSSRSSRGQNCKLAVIKPSHRQGHATEFPIKRSCSSCSKFITWASAVGVTVLLQTE